MSMTEIPFGSSGAAAGPLAPPASFVTWQAIAAPGDVFRHPREVLAHPLLSRPEKRAILASWASDASTLENAPDLRCLPGTRAEPVPLDTVLSALVALDGEAAPSRPLPPQRPRRVTVLRRIAPFGRRDDDDDDPPPCPAAVMPRPRTPPSAAALAIGLPA